VGPHRLGHPFRDLDVQGRQVVLDRQDVVGLGLHQGPGDLVRATHRVERDDPPLEVQHRQQHGNGRDRIGILVRGQLPRHPLIPLAPGADPVQALTIPGVLKAPPQRLAVDGDDPPPPNGERATDDVNLLAWALAFHFPAYPR